MKFISRPVVIDAWQVGSDLEKPHWIDVELAQGNLESVNNERHWLIHNNEHATEAPLEAAKGDWIIRGTEGELYPCCDSVFKKKYRPVS